MEPLIEGQEQQQEEENPASMEDKASYLHNLITHRLIPSVSNLSSSSRAIPLDQDFHFYNNFPQFRLPVKEIVAKSISLLKIIGSSSSIFGGRVLEFPDYPDDALDWLVNVQDEVFERLDVSLDEFWRLKKCGEKEDFEGFQVVYGKRKKAEGLKMEKETNGKRTQVYWKMQNSSSSEIPRPQEVYGFRVDNSYGKFQHVWLERSEDGLRYIHPLEKYSVENFLDRNVENEPMVPPPLDETPLTYVDNVNLLKELAAKLRSVQEFSVDLEHNHFRSYQGITCLMQISTRSEDFLIDTLKLRIYIGPYLREFFSDPTKRKVMHGADRDVLWLQRDFGIYICNLFDTQQASKRLLLERNSLEYLLIYYCGVSANKEYQTADWRVRPLSSEMIRYAREDTHYLLYIYDIMRLDLLSAGTDTEKGDALLQVYENSSALCMNLYEKSQLTDKSYLWIRGLQNEGFKQEQLAVASALFKWRDMIARKTDESTGFILPNKILLQIARQMPDTSQKLNILLGRKPSYAAQKVGAVFHLINLAKKSAASFQQDYEALQNGPIETLTNEVQGPADLMEVPTFEDSLVSNIQRNMDSASLIGSQYDDKPLVGLFAPKEVNQKSDENSPVLNYRLEIPSKEDVSATLDSKNVSVTFITALKKPSRTFGSIIGNSVGKRRSNESANGTTDKGKSPSKVDQIKSSISIPFHNFTGNVVKFTHEERCRGDEAPCAELNPATNTCKEESSMLSESGMPSSSEDPTKETVQSNNDQHPESLEFESSQFLSMEPDDEMKEESLSDLSTSFEECFRNDNQMNNRMNEGMEQPVLSAEPSALSWEPFDYAAARKEMELGGNNKDDEQEGEPRSGRKTKSSAGDQVRRFTVEGAKKKTQAPKRRQSFPASGNRSHTFK